MKIKLLLTLLCLAATSLEAREKNPFKTCEPCKYRKKSPCSWDGGAQHWYQPIYDGSNASAAAATLSDVGYPPQPRNIGIM